MPEACLYVVPGVSFISSQLSINTKKHCLTSETQSEHWREEGGTDGGKMQHKTNSESERDAENDWFTSLFIRLQRVTKSYQFTAQDCCSPLSLFLTHANAHSHTQLAPVPMVTWKKGGRDLTIELFTQQQHTHNTSHMALTHLYYSGVCVCDALKAWHHRAVSSRGLVLSSESLACVAFVFNISLLMKYFWTL